jgi:TonB family protein
VVRPGLIEGQRIKGDPQIGAPPGVRVDMVRAGQAQVRATVKMCIDRRGQIASLKLLTSTGHPAYDRHLLEEMRAWQYRPYRLETGEAVPVCTAVTFIYRLE